MKKQTINTEQADLICLMAQEVYGTNPKYPHSTHTNTIARIAVSVHLSELQFSNTAIGKYLGKHHATIIHYLKTHPDRIKFDPEYRKTHGLFLLKTRTSEYSGIVT